MNKELFFLLSAVFALVMFSCIRESEENVLNGTYHKDDKEGLRIFLMKPSTIPDKINAEVLGLDLEDVRDWYKTEKWIEKVTGLTWNNESPQRLIEIGWTLPSSSTEEYEGPFVTFDASKWPELKVLNIYGPSINAYELSNNKKLQELRCFHSPLSALDLKNNTALTHLEYAGCLTTLDLSSLTSLTDLIVFNTLITDLDVSMNTELVTLDCQRNQLTELDLSKNTKLKRLYCAQNKLTSITVNSNLEAIDCSRNRLSLSDLFVFSEIIPHTADGYYKLLGPQYWHPRTAHVGEEIDFADQSIFKDIHTQFDVKTGGIIQENGFTFPERLTSAPPDDYTLIDGKIKFKRSGTYWIIMNNEAIIARFIYPADVYIPIKID